MARPRHRINRIIRMNESSGDDDAGSGRCCNQASRRTAPAFRESSKDNNRFVFAGGSKFLRIPTPRKLRLEIYRSV